MARTNLRLEVNPFFGFSVNARSLVKEDKSASFNMICDHDPQKDEDHDPCGVSMVMTCKLCKNEDRSTFKQGKVQGDGSVLVFDAEAVADAKGGDDDAKTTLRISAHPLNEITERTISTGKPYALEPAKGSEAAYAIFVTAMEQNPERGILLTYAYSTVTKLYSLKLFNSCLVIEQLCWPEDMADLPAVPTPADAADQNVLQANAILDAMTDTFDPEDYRDTRRQRVQAMVDAAQGVPGAVIPEATGKAKAQVDMTGALDAALQAALAAKKAKTPASTATGKAPAKKAAAKKEKVTT